MEFIQKRVGCLSDIRERYLLAKARDRIKHIVFLAEQIQEQTGCTWAKALRVAEDIERRERH